MNTSSDTSEGALKDKMEAKQGWPWLALGWETENLMQMHCQNRTHFQ